MGNRPWNWRLTVLRTVKMTLIRQLMINFKTTVRADCAVSACSSLHPPIKLLQLAVGRGRGVGLWTGVRPPPQLPASQTKQTFLSTNLASLLPFEWWAARPHFQLQNDSQEILKAEWLSLVLWTLRPVFLPLNHVYFPICKIPSIHGAT